MSARSDVFPQIRVSASSANVNRELFVWHERSQLWRAAVTPGVTPDVQVKLELSRRRVPPHLNKAGQPYRRTRPDEY